MTSASDLDTFLDSLMAAERLSLDMGVPLEGAKGMYHDYLLQPRMLALASKAHPD